MPMPGCLVQYCFDSSAKSALQLGFDRLDHCGTAYARKAHLSITALFQSLHTTPSLLMVA